MPSGNNPSSSRSAHLSRGQDGDEEDVYLTSHRHISALRALSDVADIFTRRSYTMPDHQQGASKDTIGAPSISPVGMKMRFYIAHLVIASGEAGDIVGALAGALRRRAGRIEHDGPDGEVSNDDD